MEGNAIRYFIICSLLTCGIAFGYDFAKLKYLVKQQRLLQAGNRLTGNNISEYFLEQPIDHFDPLIERTYRQRYYVISDYWKSPDGPVFLYIGGEAGLMPDEVQNGEHMELAKQYGGLLFAVEHRYYGKSINPDGLELQNLQYLTSQQALADLAHFHAFATEKFNLTGKNPWISFGGSYPGNLAAWIRIKYPHLIFASVASSAPVRATVNYPGYNMVVKDSLSNPAVNGSELCAANIGKAFAMVDQMLEGKQHEQVSKDFKSCRVVREEDVPNFVSNLALPFMFIVQANDELPEIGNITSICKMMTNGSRTPYENLVRAVEVFSGTVGNFLGHERENCTDNSWETMYKFYMNTTVTGEAYSMRRQWVYQTCAQFGYYQTCENRSACLFSRHMTLEMNLRLCQEVYAIPPEEIFKRVQFTNAYYGADQPRGTRILFVNGSIDPWHKLSVLKNITNTETAIFIRGTSHIANTQREMPTDPPQLKAARKAISEKIGEWLKEARQK